MADQAETPASTTTTPSRTLAFITSCPRCQKSRTVMLDPEDVKRHLSTPPKERYVQKSFPYLDADEREALMTGTCAECWAAIMGDL